MVWSRLESVPSRVFLRYMNNVPKTMMLAEKSTLANNLRVRIGAFFERGGLRMIARSTGSTPSA